MAYNSLEPYYFPHNANGSLVDKVPADVIHLIDPYWHQFPAMDRTWANLVTLALCTIGFFSFFGNVIVIYIFSTTPALRTPANLLVINLAVCDFSFMVFMTPMMNINLYHETWILGSFMCDVYGTWGSLFGCSSILSMCMIALDRYNVIVKGMNGRPMTTKNALIKILIVHFLSALWTFPPDFGWSRYVPEGNLTSCGADYMSQTFDAWSYLVGYTVFVWGCPLFLIIWSYYHIISTVAAHEKAMREQAKKMNVKSLRSAEDVDKCAEAKLAKVALITISMWFIAWTPYTIINFMGMYRIPGLTPNLSIWSALLAKSSTMYNPMIYATSHPKFRIALKQKCPCLVFGSTEEMKPTGGGGDVASQTTQGVSESKA